MPAPVMRAAVRVRAGGGLPRGFVADAETTGPIVARASGSFQLGPFDPVRWRACRLLQRADGYAYRLVPLTDDTTGCG